jgi:glycosyltransferase involved in cell wall biosynthesis
MAQGRLTVSPDGTLAVESRAKAGAKVVLEERRGYGRAFKTGFENSTGSTIATADGDGAYPIEMLEEVTKHLLDNDLDFISCARLPLQDAESMRKRNHGGNYLITAAASLLWAHPFKDILSGM